MMLKSQWDECAVSRKAATGIEGTTKGVGKSLSLRNRDQKQRRMKPFV